MTDQSSYDDLRALGATAASAGDFRLACDHFGRALEVACLSEDPVLVDLATVNKAYALVELRDFRAPEVTALKMMLLRVTEPRASRLAAYHLARSYELQGDLEKAERYNRIALAKSRTLENPAWIASSTNRLGDIYLYKSQFQEAADCYREALMLLPGDSEDDTLRRAIIEDNLGYALMLLKQVERGIELSAAALAKLYQLEARGHALFPELDLAYGYLELGDYDASVAHGRSSLALGKEFGNASVVKNSCYLLGEACALSGDEAGAEECFDELARFYPEVRFAKQFLHAVDLRSMINLRL